MFKFNICYCVCLNFLHTMPQLDLVTFLLQQVIICGIAILTFLQYWIIIPAISKSLKTEHY